MNSLELLTEAVTGDITVGFELECIVPQDKNDPSQMEGSIVGAISDAGYGVTDDSSIEPDFEDEEFGIEIDIGTVAGKFGQQRRISASPSDFAAVSKFIAFLFTNGAYVNDSCGFHAHFGLGDLRSADSLRNLWFACYFVKEGLFNRYSHYTTDPKELEYNKTIPTFRLNDEGKKEATYGERAGVEQYEDTEYASFLSLEDSVTEFENYLNDITSKEAKIEYAAQVGMNKLGTAGFEKYNLMNIHEQGTVEWRGLRFGNMYNHGDGTLRIVGEYLKFVYKFARELAKAYGILPKYEIGGITLTDIQRYFHQGKAKRNTTSKHLADAFRETFSALNVPKSVVQRSLQEFIKQVGTRGANATQLFQDPATAEKLIRSMSTFATLAMPIFSGADYTGVSLLDPNIQVDRLRFLLELKDVGFHSATFHFKPKLWQKLLVQHGFNFVDCTFQQCSFNWEDPDNYAEYNPFYGFDQCTFIECVFTFPTNEIQDRIETAGQQKNGRWHTVQWQRFMQSEDIKSQSRETSVPVQEPETETTEESLVQQYKKDIQYLSEAPTYYTQGGRKHGRVIVDPKNWTGNVYDEYGQIVWSKLTPGLQHGVESPNPFQGSDIGSAGGIDEFETWGYEDKPGDKETRLGTFEGEMRVYTKQDGDGNTIISDNQVWDGKRWVKELSKAGQIALYNRKQRELGSEDFIQPEHEKGDIETVPDLDVPGTADASPPDQGDETEPEEMPPIDMPPIEFNPPEHLSAWPPPSVVQPQIPSALSSVKPEPNISPITTDHYNDEEGYTGPVLRPPEEGDPVPAKKQKLSLIGKTPADADEFIDIGKIPKDGPGEKPGLIDLDPDGIDGPGLGTDKEGGWAQDDDGDKLIRVSPIKLLTKRDILPKRKPPVRSSALSKDASVMGKVGKTYKGRSS